MTVCVLTLLGFPWLWPLLGDGQSPPNVPVSTATESRPAGGASAENSASQPASAPSSKPASSPASKPAVRPSDPKALARLAEAARKRSPEGEPVILDLTIAFEAETNLGQHNEFEAVHRYLARPSRIRTKMVTTTTSVERGFDGEAYWMRSGEKVQDLGDRKHERDRDEIETSIHFTENMLRLISLSRLSEQMTEIELTGDPANPSVSGTLEAFLRLRGEYATSTRIELRFDPKSGNLAEVRSTPLEGEDRTPETFQFSDYREVKGTWFPFRIKAYTTNSEKPETWIQIKSASWNDGLKLEEFKP